MGWHKVDDSRARGARLRLTCCRVFPAWAQAPLTAARPSELGAR